MSLCHNYIFNKTATRRLDNNFFFVSHNNIEKELNNKNY